MVQEIMNFSEKNGGNDDSWYNVYEETYNKFRQHKFEYPTILTNYLEPFALHNSDTELTKTSDIRICNWCQKRYRWRKSNSSNKRAFCSRSCETGKTTNYYDKNTLWY